MPTLAGEISLTMACCTFKINSAKREKTQINSPSERSEPILYCFVIEEYESPVRLGRYISIQPPNRAA